ncbi:FtsK/SpoIIIE domain-containing protein [Luteimicrobium xylanilyticum]|uniref:Ftsk domain-containing protein n=1 Tax=Luteimicrobium xylanilyticum TaxID=1133546 RepID=A0A5P9Q767_9MICO|nr:FtsK/SpoIIIE domain-containing protein [Luteimicrobium xylanilyticum]QFU97251.1 Ftsk domain-containing protein [Luteimicrobium xylanilyticum]
MRLKLTLVRAEGADDDVVVTADAATTVADVAQTIARLDPRRGAGGAGPRAGRPPGGGLTLQARLPGQERPVVLPPDAPIGDAWIGSGAVVAVVGVGTHRPEAGLGRRAPRVVVRVVEGPDAGLDVELPEGTWTVGRAPGSAVRLTDALVSKRHARLDVAQGAELVDLGSANGVEVDGGVVPRLRVDAPVRVTLGGTVLAVEPVRAVLDDVVASAGPVPFNRSPRVEPRHEGLELTAPEAPSEDDRQPFPLLGMLAPLLVGGAMFVLTHNPTSLVFVLMTPFMLAGNFVTQKRQRRRRRERLVARFDERLEGLERTLAAQALAEREGRLAEAPSTVVALAEAVRRGPLLWTRRPEHWSFLNVRLGLGAMPSRTTVGRGSRGDLLPEHAERLDALVSRYRTVDGVPVIENLHDVGALGVAGPRDRSLGSVHGVLVQLTALHSPAELAVAAIVSPAWSDDLGWLSWVPHTSSPQSPVTGPHLADSPSSAAVLLAELEGVVRSRLARGGVRRRGALRVVDAALDRGATVGSDADGTQAPLPALVVVVSDDADVDRARLTQLAEVGPDAGVYVVWLAPDVARLPGACRTFLAFDDDGAARAGLVRLGEQVDPVDLRDDVVDTSTAHDYARRMAPVLDAGAVVEDASDLPRSVALLTLLGHDLAASADAVVDRWRQNRSIHDRTPGAVPRRRKPGSLRATVGSAGVDAMQLDLRAHGPHALVGGTTGAGKSEFLQAWVLALAAEHSPDRVTFLFVDYKGGSAFADCVDLPHRVGLVTDLSPHLVRRALTSLRAELRHREHLLNRKQAKDLLELERRGDPECPPALVLVIDEFAALAGEVPEFVDGVVDVAQRGRSLGIHLIMATQRPAGVIKDNLRANTNLRVALRMADERDAVDVVDVPDPAHFDPALPGRAVAKTGPGRLQVFQSAYAGGWTSPDPDRHDVEVAELRFGTEVRWEEPDRPAEDAPDDERGPTDQQRLVRAVLAAAQVAAVPAPRRPWHDELPAVVDLARVAVPGSGPDAAAAPRTLALGLADLPDQQLQRPVGFVPDVDGHLGVYGTSGAGKTTTLRAVAAAAGWACAGSDGAAGSVHVYALDFAAGGLRVLEPLPHVGAVVDGEEGERVVALLRLLRDELESRTETFAAAHASSVDELWRTGRTDVPRLVVLLDNLAEFRDRYEAGPGRAEWFGVFRDVLANGRRLGLHVVFTADRPGAVPSYVRSFVQRNVLHRLVDDGYLAFGAPRDVLTPASPAGRAVLDDVEVQVGVLDGDPSASAQAAATTVLADRLRAAGVPDAPGVRVAPASYPSSDLPDDVAGAPALGLDTVSLEPVGFAPEGTLLVAGPPASGRTNALAWLVRSVLRADPDARAYRLGPARSALAGAAPWAGFASRPEEVAALVEELTRLVSDDASVGRLVVVVESVGDYLQTPADRAIVALAKAVRPTRHLLVADGETSGWSAPWPLLAELKAARRGLLLQPDPSDGDVILRTPLPRVARAEFPPGRGAWVARGKVARVQVPWVLDDVAAAVDAVAAGGDERLVRMG